MAVKRSVGVGNVDRTVLTSHIKNLAHVINSKGSKQETDYLSVDGLLYMTNSVCYLMDRHH